MNNGEITQMARDSGLMPTVLVPWAFELNRFAKLVAAAEREACAKVVEGEWSNVAERMYGKDCAAAIRARGQAA